MTDATPVNRYLLFPRSDDFRTFDKVSYALEHNSLLQTSATATPCGGGSALTQDLARRILVRSVDDVKRHFLFGDRVVPLTPATGNSATFSAACEPPAGDEMDSANTGLGLASPLAKPADDGTDTSPHLLDEAQDMDTKPWDDPGAKGNYWSWPIESLYQHYHLVLAIDFGQASFDVSENGTVFIDRVPRIVESLLHVLRTTIETRDEDVAHCRRWLQANVVDEHLRTDILAQLWNPEIEVSIFLLNAPLPPSDACRQTVLSPFCPVPATPDGDDGGGEAPSASQAGAPRPRTATGRIILFPPEHAPTAFTCTPEDSGPGGVDGPASQACIPLLSVCNARWLLEDEMFPSVLTDALQRYEDMCRQAGPTAVQNWPQSNLASSLEYLIRTTPECGEACFSIVLVNNTAALECTESLSFLESTVRRKNIILSVVSLNRRTHFDSAELSPLAQFLFSVGGFAVTVDYWLAMAATRLNRDWCRRFEGARCVAQQLFVHLVASFPVSSHSITRGAALAAEKEVSVLLYDGDHDLPDQVWTGPTLSLVRAVAASRFNEGWSVLMDGKDSATEAIVLARHHHTFHSGSLTLYYELRINQPVAYRRVRLTGTKALVDYFSRLHVDAAWREQTQQEAGSSWFITLSILHAQLESWMRGEQVLLQLLGNHTRFNLVRELYSLTNTRGMTTAWVNVCTVRAFAVFMHTEMTALCNNLAQVAPALSRRGNAGTAASGSWAAAAWSVLRAAMLREGHRPLTDGEDLTFVRLDDSGELVYVVQCLPFTEATDKGRPGVSSGGSSHSSGGGAASGAGTLAGGFECRMSFFSTTASDEQAMVRHLVERLNHPPEAEAAGVETTAPSTTAGAEKRQRADECRLVLHASADPQSLLLVAMVTQRRSFALLASMTRLRPPTSTALDAPPRAWLENDSVPGATHGASRGTGASIVQYFRRAGCVPYAVAPAHLAEAYVASWSFGSPEVFTDFDFAEEAFFFAVLRRLKGGFTLLYCNAGTHKSILRWQQPFHHWSGMRTASVHDVLEVRDAPGGGGGHVLSVQRCVSPHFYVHVHPRQALRDVRDDFHIATVLQSYRACATPPDGASPIRSQTALRAMQKAGTLLTSVHVESLVRYLSPAHTTCITLTSPPSLCANRGTDLRCRLMELLQGLGDRSASVAVTQFGSDYVKLLTRGSEVVPRHYRVQTSILAPLRSQTLTALLTLEADTLSGIQSHTVVVAVASMDLALLRYGLLRQYAPTCTQPMPDCTVDRTVLQSLQHLLLTFTSLHTTQQLIQRLNQTHTTADTQAADDATAQCDDEAHQPEGDAAMRERQQLEEEIMKSYSFMRTCTVEVDLTHLLQTLRLKPTASATATPTLVKRTLAALLNGLTTHATPRSELFFPFRTKASGEPGVAAQPANQNESTSASAFGFPMIMRVAATLSGSSDKHAPSLTFWVSHDGGAAAAGQSTPVTAAPGGDAASAGGTSDATHAPPQRLRVRLFIKTLPREVSALFRGYNDDGLNLSQAPVRELLRHLIIRYSSVRPDVAVDPMDGDFSSTGRPITEKDIERMQALCTEGSNVGEPLDRLLQALQARLMTTVARFCLTRAFHTAVFKRLRELVLCSSDGGEAALTPSGSGSLLESTKGPCGETMGGGGAAADEDGGEKQVPRPTTFTASDATRHTTSTTTTEAALPAEAVGTAALTSTSNRPSSRHPATAQDKPGDLSYLAQSNSATPAAMREDKELATLLRRVVLPSLLSSKQFVQDNFPVTFTQQATDYRSIDPVAATTDVFRRCVEEDNMGVVAVAHHLSYAYIPNAAFFGERWIAVLVDPSSPESPQSTASILCYELSDPPLPEERLGAACSPGATPTATPGPASPHTLLTTVAEKLRAHINAKVTQVSQLHLLRQLRDTQFANAELIPDNWGNQFRSLAFATTRPGEDARATALSEPPDVGGSQFYLRGSNVLSIPVYYKLQHQCKKVLHRITANCSRLELIQIFNRDQCFVVADDVEGDTFHYIRLVFSKDTGTSTSVTTLPPQVVGTDRYAKLVVQLFTATTNAAVKRPLQKLQDFCYFLAVQELQGHVNYVQHKMISFNDLVFLQNQKLEPITLDLRQILKSNASASSHAVVGTNQPDDDGDAVSNDNITAFAMALLFLNLRENKFKLFEIQRDQSHAVSNFVEHYNLEEGIRNDSGDSTTPAATTDGALRFVKLVDGLTDVLVSCAIVPDRARCAIVVERYTTKVPSERYTSGETESSILKQLDSYVSDTVTQLHFYAQTLHSQHTTEHAVPSLVRSLLTTSRAMRSTESLFLRHAHMSLDEVCPSVYPFLLERLCGALSVFDPCCLQIVPSTLDEEAPVQASCVAGFPWRWKEWLQNEPRVDEANFYVVCGFTVEPDTAVTSPTLPSSAVEVRGRKKAPQPSGACRTRVVPYVRRDLLISTLTTEASHAALLTELGLARNERSMAYIVLHVSLNDGISAAIFNLRDTDFLLRLLIDVVQEMEVKSTLLNDVLLQRLGYSIPSAFDEAGLARNCCGDMTNVLQSKPLSISAASYRRRVNHVRFRPGLPPDSHEEALVIIVEGLFNRGLIVNYTFPIDDAICCLYEESPRQASLAACAAAVETLIDEGLLVEDPASALRPQVSLDPVLPRRTQKRRTVVNCRLADTAGVPADALIACDYHRHILSAHVIVEAQNARSAVSESLARLNTLWRTGAQLHLYEFTRIIVQLQLKSKEVFASRVPEFQLRRESWTPGDDLLDPDLPTSEEQENRYAAPINEVLHNYMSRLRRLYPSMLVIEVSPNDQRYREDPVVVSRLQCRYGKVTGSDGETAVFCPNLYYGVLPIAEVVGRHRVGHDRFSPPLLASLRDGSENAPITSAGVLVVEVGFQVVHYALDFFVIKGERLPPGIEAGIASEFKQALMFDRAVYDASVRRVIADIRAPAAAAADRPAQQPLAVAVTNLAKHHPTPPQCSCSAVTPFRITDQNVLRVKSLASSVPSAPSNPSTRRNASTEKLYPVHTVRSRPAASGTMSSGKVTLLVPTASAAVLIHAPTGERYFYAGLIDWDSPTLYVLVAPARLEVASDYATEHHASVVANSLVALVMQAKDLLFTQLLESTQHERVNAAWEKFILPHYRGGTAPRAPGSSSLSALSRHDAPNDDELELVIRHSHRVLLHSYRPIVQQAVEPVEWSADASLLQRTQEILFPQYVLHLVRRGPVARAEDKSSAPDSSPLTLGGGGGSVTARNHADRALSEWRGSAAQGDASLNAATVLLGTRKGTVGGYPLQRLFQGSPVPTDAFVVTFARATPPSDYFLVIRCIHAASHETASTAAIVVEDAYLCCRSAPPIVWSPAGAVTVLSGDQTALMDTFVELLANCVWSSIVPHTSQAT